MEKIKPFEETPEVEAEKPEITAERIKEVRNFVEKAYALGLMPRDLIKEEIKKTKISPKYKEIHKFLRWFDKTTFPVELFGGDPKNFWPRLESHYTFDWIMGEKLIEGGAIKGGFGELPTAALLEAQRDPTKIINQEKYKKVFKETETEFIAEQTDPVDLKKITEALDKALQEKRKNQ